MQPSPAPQAVSQPPQCPGSLVGSTHTDPHWTDGVVQGVIRSTTVGSAVPHAVAVDAITKIHRKRPAGAPDRLARRPRNGAGDALSVSMLMEKPDPSSRRLSRS